MPLRLYNTLTGSVEEFRAIAEGEPPTDGEGRGGRPESPGSQRRVLFYSCGPTVYDFAHIGNFRSFLNADLLRRTLELIGYKVRHVMNMTDVGHMTEDDIADGAGEDKMAEAARRISEAKKSGTLPPDATDVDPSDPHAIAEFYINAFKRDAKLLGLKVVEEAERDSSLLPRPTQYVPQMIALIETLIAKQRAYVARDGAVYFDVQSFPQYGRLSGNTLDKLRAGGGGRVSAENQAVKRHPADFLLWKRDTAHLMRWPSPWGEGYPGWHLECSAMARALLGDEIDIHSGGEDNIFPHHECEIAQSCSATGKPIFARYWFHTRHLFVEGEKMSKSKGNFYTVSDLIARGASPAAIRLALISTHYRSNANFTMQGLRDQQRRLDYWRNVDSTVNALVKQRQRTSFRPFTVALERFREAVFDDLRISDAVAAIDIACGEFVQWRTSTNPFEQPEYQGATTWRTERSKLHRMVQVLLGGKGLRRSTTGQPKFVVIGRYRSQAEAAEVKQIRHLIAARNEARQRKDFAAADRIRDELREMGIEIKDSPQGTTWERVIQ